MIPTSNPQPPTPTWMRTVQAVVALVETSDVREVEVRTAGLRIALRRTEPWAHLGVPPAAAEQEAEASGLHMVRSPLTGIWYDSAAPDAAPFVRVGDVVDVGSVVGLVETMKVFNEVTSDAFGVVRQVLVRRGDLIAAHAAVLALEPDTSTFLPGTA